MTQTPEQRRLIRLASTINTKARRVGAEGEITASDLAEIYLQTRQCFYCRIGLQVGHYSFDHVLPFERGGANWPENIAPSCFTCNRTKFTKTPEELAAFRDLVVKCAVCQTAFHPRYAEWKAGRARVCSRSCAARLRWAK